MRVVVRVIADVPAMVTMLELPAKEIVAVTGYVVRVVYTLLLLLAYFVTMLDVITDGGWPLT